MMVSFTAWWNCVKIIAWTVEETFSEFYFTSVVMLLYWICWFDFRCHLELLKQFSIIKNDIKRDGMSGDQEEVEFEKPEETFTYASTESDWRGEAGLLASQRAKEEETLRKKKSGARVNLDVPSEGGYQRQAEHDGDDLLLQIGGVKSKRAGDKT